MPTLSNIRTEVITTLQDSSITDDSIDLLINEAICLIADTVLLPELESSGSVDSGSVSYVQIPTEWAYSRNLYGCYSSDRIVPIRNSMSAVWWDFPRIEFGTDIGNIEVVVLKGSRIYYYPIPKVPTSIFCKFYKSPDTLVNDDDVPNCIPTSLHRPLLVGYALWKLFALIEDGVEGRKVNSDYYKGEFYEALDMIDNFIDNGQSRPEPDRRSSWI